MNTPKRILLSLAILVSLVTSSYPFIVFQIQGRLEFTSEKTEEIFQWTIFILWSASLWILGFLYNNLSTADIRMFILALMAIVAAAILFCDIATHFFGYGDDEEKVLYANKVNKRKMIVQRFHGAGAIGSDYYDTIEVYRLMNWVRYQDQFRMDNFDSTKWITINQ